jgi:prepilin-type processing-associated H-X9-DG protein
MYADDNNTRVPPLNTVAFPPSNPETAGEYWWFELLANGRYVTTDVNSNINNNVWRCPTVPDADLCPPNTYGIELEGYGPMEANPAAESAGNNPDVSPNNAPGILRFGTVPGWTGPQGGRKLTTLHRPGQLWLIGDVGLPKNAAQAAQNIFPSIGYTTEFSTRQPYPPGLLPGQGWAAIYASVSPNKQAACRHGRHAEFSFADGHAESWKWQDLVSDKNDVFAIHAY